MSSPWLSTVTRSGFEIVGYATGTDRIGTDHRSGDLAYLEDVRRFEYWDGSLWQALGGGGGGAVAPLTLTGTDPATRPLTLVGAAGQSAPLLSLRNSAGTQLANFDPQGYLSAPGAALQTSDAAVTPLSVYAHAGQTADLLDVYDSTFTALLFGVGNYGGSAGNSALFVHDVTAAPSTNPTAGAVVFSAAGVLKARTPDGTVTSIAPAAGGAVAPLTLTAPTAATVPLTVIGAASQSSDLLDLKNSAGAVQVSVNAGGDTILFQATKAILGTGGGGGTIRIRTTTGSSNGALQIMPNPGATTHALLMTENVMPIDLAEQVGIVPRAGLAPTFGGGTGPMLFLANDTADPSTNPTGGGILYVTGGALKYRGTAGTVTAIAPA